MTIAIIGGGAAGLMAAYFAKLNYPDQRVILIEKNTYLGAKVIISGGGRCNVTTGILDVREVLKNYPRGNNFLRNAIHAFPPQSVIDWFESQGVPLKTEADLRVFPTSNNGRDVVGALENALKELNVELKLNHQVIDVEDGAPENFKIIFKNEAALLADTLILTTGGNAYRHTGSTGDGYSFAKKLGHTITPLAPSLSSFYTSENWSHQISGLSFKKVKFQFTSSDNQRKFERTGPFLFTHKGVSGPAVFALSGLAAFEKFNVMSPSKLTIDFFPDLNEEKFRQELTEKIDQNPNKKIDNFLAMYVPHSLAEKIVSNILEQATDKNLFLLTAAHLNKDLRQKIVSALKSFKLTIVGRGAGDEFVTAGGVDLTEVDPKTMQSRVRRGLYFAGEILDIDGFTGGFNLQASWATGALAGELL